MLDEGTLLRFQLERFDLRTKRFELITRQGFDLLPHAAQRTHDAGMPDFDG